MAQDILLDNNEVNAIVSLTAEELSKEFDCMDEDLGFMPDEGKDSTSPLPFSSTTGEEVVLTDQIHELNEQRILQQHAALSPSQSLNATVGKVQVSSKLFDWELISKDPSCANTNRRTGDLSVKCPTTCASSNYPHRKNLSNDKTIGTMPNNNEDSKEFAKELTKMRTKLVSNSFEEAQLHMISELKKGHDIFKFAHPISNQHPCTMNNLMKNISHEEFELTKDHYAILFQFFSTNWEFTDNQINWLMDVVKIEFTKLTGCSLHLEQKSRAVPMILQMIKKNKRDMWEN